MPMTSLYTGISGIKSYSEALESVADNVANLSTVGFKATRAYFQDILATQLANTQEGSQASQMGHGSMVQAQNLMTQGTVITTDSPLDMAVDGQGFFVVRHPELNQLFYTRAGQFTLDAQGNVVNPEGYILQGVMADDQGVVSGTSFVDLVVPQTALALTPTSLVELLVNLNAEEASTFSEGDAVDPSDANSYNYSTGANLVDSQGANRPIYFYYQRLDSFSGPSPTGSQHVWKVSVFENRDGAWVANPAAGANQFFLHFDTDGHLVGTSTWSTAPTGASYTFGPTLSSASDPVSNQVGETLGYTGAGSAQSFISYLDIAFGGGATGNEDVTVGSDLYSDVANAADLVNRINAAGGGYWADIVSGSVRIYSDGSAPLAVSVAEDPGGNLTLTGNTLQDVISAVDSGRTATGAIHVAAAPDAGDVISIDVGSGAVDITLSGGESATQIAALINGNSSLNSSIIASVPSGSGTVFLTARNAGTAGNAYSISLTDPDSDLVASGATLAGGMDGSATTMVDASAASGVGGVNLHLARTDTGATADITIAGGNTLGAGLALDFNTYTQDSAAGGGGVTSSDATSVDLTLDFGTAGTQTISVDHGPESTTGSTMSAGFYETMFLSQNGQSAGELQSLMVDRNGHIRGVFSNGVDRALMGVGLATFMAPDQLLRVGETLWAQSNLSGEAVTGLPGDIATGLGSIQPKALESSTVDLAQELVNLINYQRAYQANTKSVSTSDEMLKLAINLKT